MRAGIRRPIDRVVAVAAPTGLGLVLVVAAAFASAPLREGATAEPVAARELVALLARGEQQSYVVQYRFERILPNGRRLPVDAYEARGRTVLVTRTGTTLRIDGPDLSYDCDRATGKPLCEARPASHGLPYSAVLDTAIRGAPYDVRSSRAVAIAGEPARCFTVRARPGGHVLPDAVGFESRLCLAADGLILQRQVLGAALDQWTATRVVRRFDTKSLAPVIAGFERAAPVLAQ